MKLHVASASSRFSSTCFPVFLLLASLIVLAPWSAHGQAKAPRRVTQVIDESQLTTLKGHIRPDANEANDRGSVDANLQLGQIMLLLSRTPEQQQELDSLVDQLHNVHSKDYHQWLTPAEFGRRFSPADEDVTAVVNWLNSKHLIVVEIPPSKTHITFTGTVGELRDAFHVDIHRLIVNGEAHMATMNEPQVPTALAPVIAGLHKLDDFAPKPLHTKEGTFTRDPQTGRATRVNAAEPDKSVPGYTNGSAYMVGPQDFYTIYNENPLLTAGITGAGQTIAVIEEVEVNPADVGSFRAQFGLPTYPATPNSTHGGVNYIYGTNEGAGGDTACTAPLTTTTGGPNGSREEEEADIDLQWSGAVAPNAIVDFVACGGPANAPFGSQGIDYAAQHVVNYLSSTVTAASLSYGACESDMGATSTTYYNNQWEQFAAEGISAIVSTGDSGTTSCDNGSSYVNGNPSVNGLGSSAFNVSVGGTDFSDYYQTAGYTTGSASTWWGANTADNGSALSYIPEIAWGGICSNSLYSSYLNYVGQTQYGTTPEELCNSGFEPVLAAGASGGVSTFNTAPGWQNVYGVGLYSGSTTYRTVPDFSLFAADAPWNHILPFCESDVAACTTSPANDSAAGGTSFVAPQVAGLMALINQKTGSSQGQADYNLYNLAAQEYGTPGSPNTANLTKCSGSAKGASVATSCIFHDIAADTPSLQGGTIASNNVEPCLYGVITDCYASNTNDTFGLTSIPGASSSTLAYYAGAGYDLTTGLGSVNIYNLVENWTSLGAGYATVTVLSSSAQSILATSSATLTATVTDSGRGNSKTPTGTVKFYLNSTSGTLLGQGTLSGGCTGTKGATTCSATATHVVTGSTLSSGENIIVASYGGDTGDAPSNSAPFTEEVALPASHFSLTTTATVGEGSPFTLTVTALDPNGFTAVGYNGTVGFTSSDPKFVNPGTLKLASGVGQTTVTLKTLGTQTITATDTTSSTLTSTGSFTVGPGPAATFTVSVPSSAFAGATINFTVTAFDAYGAQATGYSGPIDFSSSDAYAALPAQSTLTAGTGKFSLAFATLGSQTVTATDASNSTPTGTSNSVIVSAPNLVVTTAYDDSPGGSSDCTPQAAPGTGTDSSCSLRDALAYAAAPPATPANISFSSSVFSAGNTAAQNTISLTHGSLSISQNVAITGITSGTGATLTNLVTVSAGNASTVFTVAGGVNGASLNSLNITGGKSTGHGGGITNNGTLAITSSTISGNAASSTTSGIATAGGGIYNTGTLTVTDSTISGNTLNAVGATAKGGGIYNSGSLSLYNTTVADNTITSGGNGLGGGIYTTGSANDVLLLLNCTVTANTADGQGGGVYSLQTVTVANSIVSGNVPSGSDVVNNGGTETNSGGNLIGVTDLGLTPLGTFGGPTQTYLPLPGSAAICAGTAANANSLTTDQRGFPRTVTYSGTACVDSGAVQTNYALAFTTEPPSSVIADIVISPAPVVRLTENGTPAVATNSVSMTDTASLLSGTTSAALSSGSATFSSLTLTGASASDKLKATLPLNPSLSLTAQSSAFQSTSEAPILTSPTPRSTFTGPSATFTWTTVSGGVGYWLFLGTAGVGSKNLYDSGQQSSTSATFSSLPVNGETIYARVYTRYNGTLVYNDYTYTAWMQPPVMTSPTPGSTLTGSSATFTWTAAASGNQGYWLFLGTTGVGSKNLYDSGQQTSTSASFNSLPTNGETIYARVYTRYNGTLVYNDYIYTAWMQPPVLTSPTPGSTLSGSSATFTWTAASPGNQGYWLFLGTTGVGSKNLYDSGQQTATSATFSSLPTNGVTIYARVYTRYNGVLVYNDYTYKAQ
jgi:subtilase family serine protease